MTAVGGGYVGLIETNEQPSQMFSHGSTISLSAY